MHLSDIRCIARPDEERLGQIDDECTGCSRRLTSAEAMVIPMAHIITPPMRHYGLDGFLRCPERIHSPNVHSAAELRAPTVRGVNPPLVGGA